MDKKVLAYIIENNLIESGDRILVALSGGPDSVCLLDILIKLKETLNIEIGAAHLNHMLRGEDALGDEEYVRRICKDLDIPYYIKRVDINKYAKENKLSSEMAGRSARYDFFDEIINKYGFNKIATAHNANDQAETILFRLMRGSGLEGLGGIKVSRDNKIIRPILCLSRDEVEAYIEKQGLNPRIDKTNFEKIYNRNKIRLDILPYIKENFNADIVQTLNRMSTLLQKDNEYLEKEAEKYYEKYCLKSEKHFILKKQLFNKEEAITSRVIRNALVEYSKSNYDFEMKHISEISYLAKKNSGKRVDLPNKIYAENIYGDIYIKKRIKKQILDNKLEIVINKNDIDGKKVEFYNYKIEFSVIDNNKDTLLYKKDPLKKFFDFDLIEDSIVIRKRKDGDKMIPLGMKGSKKIKDIFIDSKIPKEQRDFIPIIEFDNSIAWLTGIKVSEDYKVNNKTKNILMIYIERED